MEKQVILTEKEHQSLIDENKRLKGIIDSLKQNNSVFEIQYHYQSALGSNFFDLETRKAVVYSNDKEIQKALAMVKKISDKVNSMSLIQRFLDEENKELKKELSQLKSKNCFEMVFNL